jgi:hypothetical protein
MIMSLPEEDEDRKRVLNKLRWLTTTFRPLAVKEFAKAMLITKTSGETLEEAVMDSIGGAGDLITVSESENVFRLPTDEPRKVPVTRYITLVHSSVAQFLSEKDCDAMLARFCLDYTLGTIRRKGDIAFGMPPRWLPTIEDSANIVRRCQAREGLAPPVRLSAVLLPLSFPQ